jgi:hypothetical protein
MKVGDCEEVEVKRLLMPPDIEKDYARTQVIVERKNNMFF